MTHACNCVGPQNGDPVCPCQMAGRAYGDAFAKLARGEDPADARIRRIVREEIMLERERQRQQRMAII